MNKRTMLLSVLLAASQANAAGLGFDVNKNIELRAEYVIRDNIDSLQANLVFRQ